MCAGFGWREPYRGNGVNFLGAYVSGVLEISSYRGGTRILAAGDRAQCNETQQNATPVARKNLRLGKLTRLKTIA